MKLLIGLLLVSLFRLAEAQPVPNFQELAEKLIGQPDPDTDNAEGLYENLLLLYEQPLNLNTANAEELQQLNVLTPEQVYGLIVHRQQTGPLLSVYELQAIPAFSAAAIRTLLPLVTVSPPPLHKGVNQTIWGRNTARYFIFRWERTLPLAKGYSADSLGPAYFGSPDRFLLRFRAYNSQRLSLGFTLEKDAGEPLDWSPHQKQYGPDFLSGHILLKGKGLIKQLMLGDFWAQAGQGLVFGRGLVLGRGAEPVATLSQGGNNLRPHTASLEAGFFRGMGLSLGASRLRGTLVVSHQAQNAVLYSQPDSSLTYFRSIREDGYHRRPSEAAARKSLQQTDLGGSLLYSHKSGLGRLGLNFLHSRFSIPRIPAQQLFHQQAFQGKSNTVGSIFGEQTLGSLHLFAELAGSADGGTGGIIGVQSSLHPRLDVALSLRHYAANFHSFYARAFAEGSEARNEQGLYMGSKLRLPLRMSLSAYFDYFRFPTARYRLAQALSPGYESLVRLSWQPDKDKEMYVQYQLQEKERSLSQELATPALLTTRRHALWLHIAHQKQRQLSFQHRLQLSRFQAAAISKGLLVYSEMQYQAKQLRSSLRLGYFHTTDYDSRIYTYERNVLWAFSFPAFSGQGIRAYWLQQYRISQRLSSWFRWASTRYFDRQEIRSGQETISGPWIHQITVQLKYDF